MVMTGGGVGAMGTWLGDSILLPLSGALLGGVSFLGMLSMALAVYS